LREYLRRWVGARYTTVRGSDFRVSNANVAPALTFATDTSENSFAAVSVSITRAVQSVSVPCELDVEVRIHGGDNRLQRALLCRGQPSPISPR